MQVSKTLPESGGILDQDQRLIEMILIIEEEFQKHIKKETDKLKKEAERLSKK